MPETPEAVLETRQEGDLNAQNPPQSEHHAAQRGARSGAHERHTPRQRAPQSDSALAVLLVAARRVLDVDVSSLPLFLTKLRTETDETLIIHFMRV